MEFLSHVEKNSVCDALPMSNSSELDSAASFPGFPFNAGTMNSSTLENWIQFHNGGRRKDETPTCDNRATGISLSSSVAQQASHGSVSLSSTVNSEATSVTTKALLTPSVSSISSAYLSVNGASGKVSKKRSRASRRAPTTLLSTDASNFRAMVQQFTGIPEPPFWSVEQRSQAPLLNHSYSHASLLPFASVPAYHNYRPQQQYTSFPFKSALRENINNSAGISSHQHIAPRTSLLDDVGLNSSYSPVFSSSLSEGRAGYPI